MFSTVKPAVKDNFVSVVVVVLKFGSDQGFCFKRTLVAVLRTFV